MKTIVVLMLCVALCGCGIQEIAGDYLECLMLSDHATLFKNADGSPAGLIEVRDRVTYTFGALSGNAIDCEPVNWDDKDYWYAVRIETGTPLDWITVDPNGIPNMPPWLEDAGS